MGNNGTGVKVSENVCIRGANGNLKEIHPKDIILCLPHCLRRTETCKATYDKEAGLQCKRCNPDCAINRILDAAERRGIEHICVSPGGRMVINYLKSHPGKAIIAVACPKEIEEGVGILKDLNMLERCILCTVNLTKDGCVNTEVDVDEVVALIGT